MLRIAIWVALGSLVVPGLSPAQVGPAAETPVPAGEAIRFRATGLKSDTGQVVCALFAEDGWLKEPLATALVPIAEGVAICVFEHPEKGIRGISAYHDADADGQLATNFLHIPKEGTCASNNAFRKMGPPRFRDARFDYQGGLLELEAEMRYLSGK